MKPREGVMQGLDGRLAAMLGRALPVTAMIAALALGAWLAARWFVYFTTPPVTPAPPARETITIAAAAQTLAETHVFGVAPLAGGLAVSSLNIKLRGVFAGTPGAPGYAIVNTGGRDQTARAGTEIVPGVALESVHAKHIVLKRNGVFERVNLEERPVLAQAAPRPAPPSPSAAPAPARPSGPAPGAAPAPSQPQQPAGPGARFQRPEPYAPVGDVPTEPPPPATPAPTKPPAPQGSAQGLVVSSVPAGSVLERIGLQPGDVIKSVNGQSVASEADVARVLKDRSPLAPVNAEVVRGGAIVPLTVSAASALRP
jgi:general secretion pathway protein C